MMDAQDARSIYQRLLDDIGEAIATKDSARYAMYFSFPHHLQTFEKSVLVENVDALNRYFDRLIAHLEQLAVPELVRHCTIADFVDPHTIRGCHETRLINTSTIIVEDYSALSTLKHCNGAWKVSASQYAESESSLPTRLTD